MSALGRKLFSRTATLAKSGASNLNKDIRPADAVVTVDSSKLLTTSASEKSQGLPNADGEKPGKGNGYGHFKDRGLGHEFGHLRRLFRR
jgi:hypothetical protein